MLDRRHLAALALAAGLAAGCVALTVAVPAGATEDGAPMQCTLVAEAGSGAVVVRDGACDRRATPASTFKFPIALMGYDAGVLKDATSPRWDYRAEFDAPERARKPIDPTSWEKESIVWYSQEITRKLGMARFRGYVEAFDYGNEDVTGTPGRDDGLTQAWLMSSLAISPTEQVAFVRAFLARSLPVSPRAFEMTAAILPVFAAPGGWTVHGKTGSGWLRHPDGRPNRDRPVGWFVGWAEKAGRTVAFARLRINEGRTPRPLSLAVRDGLLAELDGLVGPAPK